MVQDISNDKLKEAEKAYKEKKKEFVSNEALPKVDMNTFILSLSSSVLVYLGEVPDPTTGKITQNLEMARQTIDILGLLEEKTKGNLTEDEERLLKSVLFDLRMKYVQKC